MTTQMNVGAIVSTGETNAFGSCSMPPENFGHVNMGPYPGLVHNPTQGARFAHNGRSVDELAGIHKLGPVAADYVKGLAESLGVSFGDVCDGLKYLHDSKGI